MDDIEKWQRKALQLRYKAIGLLRDSVEYDLHAKTRPKYKELLATMLSMITIDVSEGLSTCYTKANSTFRLLPVIQAHAAYI